MATLVSQIIILLKSVGMLPSAPYGSRILPRYISGQAISFLSEILWKDRSKFVLKILEHLHNEGIWVFIALFPHLGAEGDVPIWHRGLGSTQQSLCEEHWECPSTAWSCQKAAERNQLRGQPGGTPEPQREAEPSCKSHLEGAALQEQSSEGTEEWWSSLSAPTHPWRTPQGPES